MRSIRAKQRDQCIAIASKTGRSAALCKPVPDTGSGGMAGTRHQDRPRTLIVPQIATEIPATDNHTLRFRTNAAHARAARAARASQSISLKYSTMRPTRSSAMPISHGNGARRPVADH
jgi:hypothetical protein